MKVDYDSKADALSIDLLSADRWDEGEGVDEQQICNVSFRKGKLVNVELLYPAENLGLLEVAAQRFDLDGQALLAAARAGLSAPDRQVTVEVGDSLSA